MSTGSHPEGLVRLGASGALEAVLERLHDARLAGDDEAVVQALTDESEARIAVHQERMDSLTPEEKAALADRVAVLRHNVSQRIRRKEQGNPMSKDDTEFQIQFEGMGHVAYVGDRAVVHLDGDADLDVVDEQARALRVLIAHRREEERTSVSRRERDAGIAALEDTLDEEMRSPRLHRIFVNLYDNGVRAPGKAPAADEPEQQVAPQQVEQSPSTGRPQLRIGDRVRVSDRATWPKSKRYNPARGLRGKIAVIIDGPTEDGDWIVVSEHLDVRTDVEAQFLTHLDPVPAPHPEQGWEAMSPEERVSAFPLNSLVYISEDATWENGVVHPLAGQTHRVTTVGRLGVWAATHIINPRFLSVVGQP